MKKQFSLLPLFGLVCLFSCNSADQPTTAKPATEDSIAVKPNVADTIAVQQPTKLETDTAFYKHAATFKTLNDSTFRYNEMVLTCIQNDSDLHFIPLSKREPFDIQLTKWYDGPGFQIDLYEPVTGADKYYLVIEAQGDPGTDWYLIAKVENNKVVLQQKIEEPRANSEETSIKQFLGIYETGGQAVLQFKKKYVAGYSTVPKDMKQDKLNYYLGFPLK